MHCLQGPWMGELRWGLLWVGDLLRCTSSNGTVSLCNCCSSRPSAISSDVNTLFDGLARLFWLILRRGNVFSGSFSGVGTNMTGLTSCNRVTIRVACKVSKVVLQNCSVETCFRFGVTKDQGTVVGSDYVQSFSGCLLMRMALNWYRGASGWGSNLREP